MDFSVFKRKFIPNSFEKDEVIPPTPLNKGGNEPSKLYKYVIDDLIFMVNIILYFFHKVYIYYNL